MDTSKYYSVLEKNHMKHLGRVMKVVGLTIESIGPDAKLNDLCRISIGDGRYVMAEVVGFRDNRLLLMPYESVEGIKIGCIVENTGAPLMIPVGPELLGHTVNGIGIPTDTDEPIEFHEYYPAVANPPDPMQRVIIKDVLPLGVKAVDGLITVGKGQRIGIFAGSGVGKSTLMGMFARNTKADINVIALIGERGREVREFVEHDLGEEGMKRSVVVVATSDKPALIRNKAAKTATAIAEYFRDQGKDVLLMMDSLTRFCMAQRQIGLASGEPPVTARSILDGHIVLNRRLAQRNHYPAIDVLASISRVMSAIASKEHKKAAGRLKNCMATYAEAEDLINIGAYRQGSNKNIDFAISKNDAINDYLLQSTDERYTFEDEVKMLEDMFPEEG